MRPSIARFSDMPGRELSIAEYMFVYTNFVCSQADLCELISTKSLVLWLIRWLNSLHGGVTSTDPSSVKRASYNTVSSLFWYKW